MAVTDRPPALAYRVIVLAPVGRDAAVITEALARVGVTAAVVQSTEALSAAVRAGAGAVLVTEEALTAGGVTELLAALADQPSWSDLPIVLLLAGDDALPETARHITTLASARAITVLRRPIPAITLVTAVQSALRARRRQYEIRDLIMRERAAREQAETATRIKDDFLATVSHELRTPLSAILLWGQLLEAGRLTPEQARHAMHAIRRGAEAQSQLIEDLLDVSRMLTGKLRLDVRVRQLAPIVLAAVEVVRPMAEAKGVRVDVQLEAASELALVDAERAQQIFWNLLSNAVKFAPGGGIVTVRVERERDRLRVAVTDTGQGIPPTLLPHIFERFIQGDPAATRRKGGLGLGLTIVHQLVELHGGTIDVTSAGEGKGATFTVRLPVAAHELPSEKPRAIGPTTGASLTGVHVLLVEDEPELLDALTWLLQYAGARVTAVESVAAARDVLAAAHPDGPDILVSDIGLPDNDGNALVRALRADEQRTGAAAFPAIAISAWARDDDRRRALESGFQIHIPKPITPGTLQAAIRNLLDSGS